jgi:hypothetical protein
MQLQSWYLFVVLCVLTLMFPTPVAASAAVAGNVICVFLFLGLGFFFGCVGLGMNLLCNE